MRPKIFTAILLFISAYSPLFLMLAVKDFDFECNHAFKHPYFSFSILALIVLSILLLFYSISSIKPGTMSVTVTAVKNRSIDIIGYTIPYMLAFLGIDLSKPEDLICTILFLLILLIITVTSQSVFINPILTMAGYGLYDLEYEFDGTAASTVIISKLEVKKGKRYYIRRITRFLYFVPLEAHHDQSQHTPEA